MAAFAAVAVAAGSENVLPDSVVAAAVVECFVEIADYAVDLTDFHGAADAES